MTTEQEREKDQNDRIEDLRRQVEVLEKQMSVVYSFLNDLRAEMLKERK